MSTTSNRSASISEQDSASGQRAPQTALMTEEQASESELHSAAESDLGKVASSKTRGSQSRTAQNAPVRWAWNVPLLIGSLAVIGIGLPILGGLYFWQSSRIGSQLLELADRAATENNPREEMQWLQRYLSLRPDDGEALVRFAFLADGMAQSRAEVDQARRSLTRALTAVEASDAEPSTAEALRRRLIERMVELGGNWLVEAERQIIALNPPAEDPQALEQLARSVLGQEVNQSPRRAVTEPPSQSEDYWRWVAAQPIGEVLRLAVKANPQSVELTAALVDAYLDRPQWFSSPDEAVADAQKIRLQDATQLVQQLSERRDDGHAQWTAFYYAEREEIRAQIQPLAVMAAEAQRRLQQHAESWSNRVAMQDQGSYQPIWDVQLVLTHAANLASGQAYDAAKDQYQMLVSLPEGMIASNQLEPSFLGLGRAYWYGDQHEEAKTAWETGNKRLGGNSLVLLEALAGAAAQDSSIEEARRSVEEFAAAIESVSVWLATARSTLSVSQLETRQSQLNKATWRVGVLRAQVDYRDGQYRSAAQQLERALASQLNVDTSLRVEAAELLAAVYSEQKLWDLAGRALDDAASLAPNDRSLRQRAASAWLQASAANRAAEQWQRADDGSYASAIAYAKAMVANLAAQPPAQRDQRLLLTAIKEAQRRWDAAVEAGHPPADGWRLELLKMAVQQDPANVPSGTTGGVAVQPGSTGEQQSSPQGFAALSEQYPDAIELQAVAALALLESGDLAASHAAVERLQAIEGVDPVLVLEVRARVLAQQDLPLEAVELLRQAANSGSPDRLRIIRFAASFLPSIGHPKEALELLRSLQPAEHDVHSLLQLGQLLMGAAAASADASGPVAAKGSVSKVESELQQIEQLLREREGSEGTHWRLLAAQRLLIAENAESGRRRQRLAQAATLHAEIISRRPRWARGLALGGRIAAEQGDHRKAVGWLRRAIAEGDKDAGTVLLLVKQLNRLGDVAAAEQELQRLESLMDSVGQVSALAVGLALGQGKYDNALVRARTGAAARPDDPDAQVVLAQAAFAAAKSGADNSEQLYAEAESSLQRAVELSRGRSVGVWQALFRFRADTGGKPAAREVLRAMESSALPDQERYLAVGSGYFAIADWEPAGVWLAKARQANPADVRVILTQASLFQAINRSDAMIEALEEAYRLAPQRDDIRRRLALSLAAIGSQEVDWKRIDQLVGADRRDLTQTDRLYHALILVNRGAEEQINQARELLGQLVHSDDAAAAEDATRLLLTVERNRWDAAKEKGATAEEAETFQECRRLFELLVRRSNPNPNDLGAYAEWLLRADQTVEAKAVIDRLVNVSPASSPALDMRLRLAQVEGKSSEHAGLVEAWLELPANRASTDALARACQILVKRGLVNEALELLASSYKNDPTLLRNYVVALAQVEKVRDAVDVCVKHFQKHRTPESVALLADVIGQRFAIDAIDEVVEHTLTDAVKEFPTNFQLLQAVGTLRLTQHRYTDAVAIYLQCEKINPLSLVTLNNLAVAFSELPGRQDDALLRIERAIELYGRNPELLDTFGTALLRANRLEQAEAALREAYQASQDQRHLLHLLMVLDANKKTSELKRLWNEFDATKIDKNFLSASEQPHFERLVTKLGGQRET